MRELGDTDRRLNFVEAGKRYVIWAIFVLAVGAYGTLRMVPPDGNPVGSDGFSYYVYLPSWVIYADPTLEDLADRQFGGSYPKWSGLTRWPGTGRWVNPHQMGVAVLLLPFYLAGHAFTLLRHYPTDGFSYFYRHSAALGGAFYLAVGLFFLKRLLDRHAQTGVVFATLVTITFGTNLFHYATYDALWSHVYSFALIACFLDLLDGWERQPSRGRTLGIGIVVGLIVMVRQVNALVLLFVLLFGVVDLASLRARPRVLLARLPQLAVMAAVAALVMEPQLAFFKSATGSFFADPYRNLLADMRVDAFDFRHPHLVEVLVGVRKGLFFWSPALLLSVAGCLVMRGALRAFLLPSVAVIAINTLLVASWWDWQFGGSYGHRGFTDFLAVFALPMAGLYERVAGLPRRKAAVTLFARLAVALSVAQMLQYWVGIIPYSDVTWDQYRRFFLMFPR